MIKFYEKRKIFFAISGLIMAVGIIAMLFNGINLSIQFKGGALIKYTYTGEIDVKNAEKIATETLKRNCDVQTTTNIATNNNSIIFNLSGNGGLSSEEQSAFDKALKSEFKDSKLEMSESNIVEPFIGKKFLQNGILAIFLSAILIILYVWIRFTKISGLSAGVMALVALAHDCLIVFFTFIIFKFPINDSFIAIMLTIIGYSINDTIIIYDRIRENRNLNPKTPIEQLVNLSITQSMSRSINTGLTTFACVIIVYVFASIYNIESIKIFALPMAIGVISGCYSTICIAGPLWVMWQKHKAKA